TRGCGFAVLGGSDRVIDWGGKETRTDKKQRSLELVENLIERYQPSVIVVEDYAGKGSRRGDRVGELLDDIAQLALNRRIKGRSFSRLKVKQAWATSGASNKFETAIAIAKRCPELALRLPRFRKPWMSEDYRMSIFDAVAFGVTFSATSTPTLCR